MKKETVFRNDHGFGYFVFVSGSHGHIKTRVWVHNTLVKEGRSSWTGEPCEVVEIPVKGGEIHQTEKGSLVLRSDEKGIVYLVEIPSGYRGSAEITDVQGGTVVAQGHRFHSGQGALGETAWALVNAQGPIEVFGRRDGRRIDDPEVAFRLTPDGEKEELVTDQEVCDLL